jgi:hypothetical protein
MVDFVYEEFLSHFLSSFSCHKILLHGASSFTSPPMEACFAAFITLKNASPWLGLNL